MAFMDWIIEQLEIVRDQLLDAYYEVWGWIWPFWYLGYPLYGLYSAFHYLVYYFGAFNLWLEWANERVKEIISEWDVWSLIQHWFPNLRHIVGWFYTWTWEVWELILQFWDWITPTVSSWIDAAWAKTKLWLDYLEGRVNELTSSWNTFITVTLPTLPNWLDIEALIKSWFANFSPLWEGWQDWRDKVTEFFSDPEDWLYKATDRIVERFW